MYFTIKTEIESNLRNVLLYKQDDILDKEETMDNVQTFRSYLLLTCPCSTPVCVCTCVRAHLPLQAQLKPAWFSSLHAVFKSKFIMCSFNVHSPSDFHILRIKAAPFFQMSTDLIPTSLSYFPPVEGFYLPSYELIPVPFSQLLL
jgi:hypothetical protein